MSLSGGVLFPRPGRESHSGALRITRSHARSDLVSGVNVHHGSFPAVRQFSTFSVHTLLYTMYPLKCPFRTRTYPKDLNPCSAREE